MQRVLKIKSLVSGLNNQRMAIAGLFEIANRTNAKVQLPNYIVDFTPTKKHTVLHETVPIWSVFNKSIFFNNKYLTEYVTEESETEILGMDTCFTAGANGLTEADKCSANNIAKQVIMSMVIADDLKIIADKVVDKIYSQKIIALQLRIERDWQEYLTKKFGDINVLTDTEEITVNVERILTKIKNTREASCFDTIYCCCDEDDLLLSVDEIKKIARSMSFTLLFKNDVQVDFPTSRVKRSLIDHYIATMLPAYVGTTRSSFSQIVRLLKKWSDKNDKMYFIFNNSGDTIKLIV